MTAIRLNQVVYPVTALGPGIRLGIWFQGCTIACSGCMARDTWDPDGGSEATVQELLAITRRHITEQLDGVTISGGEPFQQPSALFELLSGLIEIRRATDSQFDILAYSGFRRSHLDENFGHIVSLLDALVAEPFVASQPSNGAWRGSANQEIAPQTDLGRTRYSTSALADQRPTLQVDASNGRFSLIGVPMRGDLEALSARLGDAGIQLGDVSWR